MLRAKGEKLDIYFVSDNFKPDEFAESIWVDKVVPFFKDKSLPIETIIPVWLNDQQAAGEEFGYRDPAVARLDFLGPGTEHDPITHGFGLAHVEIADPDADRAHHPDQTSGDGVGIKEGGGFITDQAFDEPEGRVGENERDDQSVGQDLQVWFLAF